VRLSSASVLRLGLVLSLGATGCAASPAMRAAERGDYPALKARLADDLAKGKISGGKARDLAHAVAKREVLEAKGEEGVTRSGEMLSCARQAEDILSARAKGTDDGAARAAFVLVDARVQSPSRWSDRVRSEDGAWRAVGARSLVERDQATKRRELLLDLDPRVRRGAVLATLDAPVADDAGALLETVRLDPDPVTRSFAAERSCSA
jgi:hypothetical protein